MSLTTRQQYDVDMSVTGKQTPVGGILNALMQGKVGPVAPGRSYAAGFDATALNALMAAASTTTPQQTTDATAGTTTTVTVENVGIAPVFWHLVNASGETPPNIQSMSYDAATQTATFTVASSIASQTYRIQFI